MTEHFVEYYENREDYAAEVTARISRARALLVDLALSQGPCDVFQSFNMTQSTEGHHVMTLTAKNAVGREFSLLVELPYFMPPANDSVARSPS
jgi:hypothetical protein